MAGGLKRGHEDRLTKEEILERVRNLAPKALDTLLELIRDNKSPASRRRAARIIFDMRLGKGSVHVKDSVDMERVAEAVEDLKRWLKAE